MTLPQSALSPLLIRADASPQVGTGHVMRCLALAQAWKEAGGRVVFLMGTAAPALEQRLRGEGMEVRLGEAISGGESDARQTVAIAREVGARWIVVDGYAFGASYQKQIKEQGFSLLFIDDYGHAEHYHADLVLNQNLYAEENLYASREPFTRLLLGTNYVLLRREFWPWFGRQRAIEPQARRVLVTLGGSDPDNITLGLMKSLEQVRCDGLEAIIVAGSVNAHYDELVRAAQSMTFPVRVEQNVTNMPELMAWADIVVLSGGSTCWEVAFLGLPALVLPITAHEHPFALSLEKRGTVVNLGNHAALSSEQIAARIEQLLADCDERGAMSERGQKLIDGYGAQKVIALLK